MHRANALSLRLRPMAAALGASAAKIAAQDGAPLPRRAMKQWAAVINELASGVRMEKDSMGTVEVPAFAYFGATTQRARLNFPISRMRFQRCFIKALGQIKQSAARVNRELGVLDPRLAEAIIEASQKVIDGRYDSEFVVDIFQTGSGTSTNMNANEVISNIAIEALGGVLGSRTPVHPNDHVNCGQSSNDVIPTAMHLAAASAISTQLLPALLELEAELRVKADEFWPIVKTGRTHLQDATPIRLGQEFLGYVGMVELGRHRCEAALGELCALALGGTAVGTGIGMHPEFASRVIEQLRALTGLPLVETGNHFQAQATIDGVVQASGSLNTLACSLMKIANDVRWLGSGPRAGIGELTLPEVQPGSSIMPGKVNPVIAESVTMVCAQVMGNNTIISVSGQSGNFELNVMLPVAAHALIQSVELLAAASRNFARQCVKGLGATSKGPDMVNKGLMTCTNLVPNLGYDKAAAIAKKAAASGRTIMEVALEETTLSEAELRVILDPLAMVGGGGKAKL